MNGIASGKVFIDTPSEIFSRWPLWRSWMSLDVTNSFLPITWEPNEIETWDCCHCVCLRKAGAYRPYRKYRKCGMAGGDVPRGAPSGKNKKNGKEPSRAEGPRGPLDSGPRMCVGGGDRSPRGPWYGPRGPWYGPRAQHMCNICDI